MVEHLPQQQQVRRFPHDQHLASTDFETTNDLGQAAPDFRRHAGVGGQATDGDERVREQVGVRSIHQSGHDVVADEHPAQFEFAFPVVANAKLRFVGRA